MKDRHLLLGLFALLVACAPQAAVPLPIAPSGEGVAIAVYFSDPQSPAAHTVRGGPDARLAAAIAAAQVSVDMAIYDLDLWSVRDALLEAQQRGVLVRLVVESDNLRRSAELQLLQAAGIAIVDDRRREFMHNKFTIIDRQHIWTGSMNYTVSGAYFSRNNLLHIDSPALAENYLAEFEEMFFGFDFGEFSPANTPYPSLDLEGVLVETYFAPEDGALRRLVGLVNAAEESIHFMAFSFTSDELAAAVHAAAVRGVVVRGVMDEDQGLHNTGGEYFGFMEAGLAVRLDGERGAMHHKVLVIDERIVVTGSYNFSNSAERRNDENLLVITSPELAAEYLAEFERIWELALP
ncbi:MAG: hypothetical protein KIS85_03795 [Anaerolineales bacterium]|nr:hypothetical protein [Anaerolineales bacterium]